MNAKQLQLSQIELEESVVPSTALNGGLNEQISGGDVIVILIIIAFF
jgi:hypothetical protein